MNFYFIFNFVLIFLFVTLYECKTYNVRNSDELKKALKRVKPGDTINLGDGVYAGKFTSSNSGTKESRIKMKGTKKSILTNPGSDGFSLTGDWWILDGFSVYKVARGIVLDFSRNNILRNLHVSFTENAAIKFRNNSTDNLLEYSTISYTGQADPSNGEAVYVGASMNFWIDGKTGPDRSSRNTISNNHFGPYVSSESIDIKEGVDNIVVENNYIDGTGMDDKNYSQTWVSVKGFNCTIQNNYGKTSVLDGFTARTVKNKITNSGCNNKFLNNTCRKLAKNGQCVNLSLVKCKNKELNNVVIS